MAAFRTTVFARVSLVVWGLLGLGAAATAVATPVQTPLERVLAVPAAACHGAAAARFESLRATFGLADWDFVGGARAGWVLTLDPDRAAALGVPLRELRSKVEQLLDLLAEGALAADAGAFEEMRLQGIGGEVPLSVVVSLARHPIPAPVRLSLDRERVVAATGPRRGGALDLVFAALALSAACEVPATAVQFETFAADQLSWRLSYRTATDSPEHSFARGRLLLGKLATPGPAGVLLGLHGHRGGAIYGIQRARRALALPRFAALATAGVEMVLQHAAKGQWSRPFLAVVRIVAAPEYLDAAFAHGSALVRGAGPQTKLMLADVTEVLTFEPDVQKFATIPRLSRGPRLVRRV
jgi:hypothetical protein